MRLLIALSFALLAACSKPPQPLAASPQADSGFAAGTLAPFGSFEFEVAPSYTGAIVELHLARVALDKGQISAATAQQIHDRMKGVLSLLKQAVGECSPDPQTHACTQSVVRARATLARASSTLALIQKDYSL